MDLFLNFKNKGFEAKYHGSIDLYINKVLRTNFVFMIAILPFYPYSQFATIQASSQPKDENVRAVFTAMFYGATIINSVMIWRFKSAMKRHPELTRWIFDLFFFAFAGYFAYYFWVYGSTTLDPINNHLEGWLFAFITVLILSPISRWYLKIFGYLTIMIRIGTCASIADPSQNVYLKFTQLLIIEPAVIYLSERDKRKYFLDKHSLFEDTRVYKEIFELTSDGVIIYGLKDGLVFNNWSNDNKCPWRDPEESLQKTFEKITIRGYKKVSGLPSSIELDLDSLVNTENQSSFWVFLNHLILQLSPFQILKQKSSSRTGETLKPGHLLLLTGTVDQQSADLSASENSYLLAIKIMITTFQDKPSLVFLFSDITERRLVMALQKNNNYKDRLLASVSHELRTPLNASINFTQEAIEHPDLQEHSEIRENYLMPALRSNQVLLHLINDILDFSQMTANKLRLVYETKNISETLNGCISLLQIQMFRKGLKLSFEFTSEDGSNEFCTDHNRLEQITLNLLSNALKFTLKGEIKIDARITYSNDSLMDNRLDGIASSEHRIPRGTGQRILSVSVKDSGIGISEENKRKLFKAFEKIELGERLSINSQGVGLGLVISNNLVLMLGPERQNNGMKVESLERQGSTFSFWIIDKREDIKAKQPLSQSEDFCIRTNEFDGDTQNRLDTIASLKPKKSMDSRKIDRLIKAATPQAALPKPQQPLHMTDISKYSQILVVDDDVFNIFALQMVLNKLGYSCDIAYNGEQAIEKVLERGEENQKSKISKSVQYQLIFMDWSMPIMDGLTATMVLKGKMKNKEIEEISIVACTAFWSEKEKSRAHEAGIDTFCFKPLNKEKVSDLAKKFVLTKI